MNSTSEQFCAQVSVDSTPFTDRLLGLNFSNISSGRLISWVSMGLLTPGNKTLLFIDATGLNHCQSDPLAFETLKHAQLLIARGRALQIQLSAQHRANEQAQAKERLYDELLLELEHRQLHLTFLSADKASSRELEQQLIERYPALQFHIESLNDQYRFSTRELASKIAGSGSNVIISLLPSPQQERIFSRLNRLLQNQFFIGIGEGLTDSLIELRQSRSNIWNRSALWLRKKRHSILLKPAQWSGYLANWFNAKLAPETQGTAFNRALLGSGWRTRLLRMIIALKARSFATRRRFGVFLKRTLDLIGVGTGLLLLSPLLLIVALLIKLTSPGPIFYSQMRVGLRGKLFRMWKFRSMYTDADQRKAALEAQNEMAGGVLFKMKRDPRITPIGRIIRRLSIDELPQLLNVLTGEMSLVGPRPALPQEVAAYPVLARARLEVKPGLTGLWQISGRSDLPFDKQVLLDTAYVHTQSTKNDIKLIAKTIPAVVSGKGAY